MVRVLVTLAAVSSGTPVAVVLVVAILAVLAVLVGSCVLYRRDRRSR